MRIPSPSFRKRTEGVFHCVARPHLVSRCGRPPAVTVRAADLAFRDFLRDPVSTPSPSYQCTHRAPLIPVNVVKFKYDDIGLAAIDARVLRKIVVDEAPIQRAVATVMRRNPVVQELCRMPGVVGSAINARAVSADRLPRTHCLDAKTIFLKRLPFAASPTPLHRSDDNGRVCQQYRTQMVRRLRRHKVRPAGIEPTSFRLEGGCLIR